MRLIIFKALLLALIFGLASARPVFAYVDPNVGGMLFQALAAGFAVLSGILLLFSRQIRTGLGRARRALRSRGVNDSQQAPTESPRDQSDDGSVE